MEKYYTTDDTAFAAYLYLVGCEFLPGTIWTRDTFRKKYILKNNPEIEKHEQDFYLRRTSIVPLDYHDARVYVSRLLKKKIEDPRFSDRKML